MADERGLILSVDKAVRILERLALPSGESTSLGALAADLGINKSSLHHTLATLRARGWAEQDEAGHYRLGPASAAIARWWSNPNQLANLVRPALHEVCHECSETVHLGTMSGRSIVYLDKVEPDRAVRVVSQVGRLVPAASTAMGRAIIGATTESSATLQQWIDAVPAPRSELGARLEQERLRVRTSGYAIEIEENEPGIACVGVPILLNDEVAAAMSVTMPVERCSQERLRQLAAEINSAVRRLNTNSIRPYTPDI